jgi:hypothetical protein
VDMPAAYADSALVGRMRNARVHAHYLVALSLQIETATYAAERARRESMGHEARTTSSSISAGPANSASAERTEGCDEYLISRKWLIARK